VPSFTLRTTKLTTIGAFSRVAVTAEVVDNGFSIATRNLTSASPGR